MMEVGAATSDGPVRGVALRQVLAELQAEARDVFASSGLTVDRFLRERWDEAERGGLPA
jgi:hypothetical protein